MAATIAELNWAARIRCAVFADEFAYLDPQHFPAGREVDGFDLLPTTVNFLGLVDGEPVATVRLLFPNADVAARCNILRGLNIERYLELRHILPDMTLAEIPRSSMLKPYRRTGIMRHLYFAAYEECLRRGCTHWVAVANTETDCQADAATVLRLLERRGWWLSDFDARHRKPTTAPAASRYPLYSEAQREEVRLGHGVDVPLPRTLELFASKMGMRYFGAPFFDGDFRMFAMPLIMSMRDFAAAPYGSLPAAA
jgi:GNAT superfamily N-acetyltransferase